MNSGNEKNILKENKKYQGKDNNNVNKSDYLDKICGMNDCQLLKECERVIWLSAFASNNPRSDYHWKCDACYDICSLRGRLDMYEKAYKESLR